MRSVQLDKLLSNLDIRVEPFTLCEVRPGRRFRVPGSPRVMLHFVLTGSGLVRSAAGTAQPLGQCTLAVVPKGASHSLEAESGSPVGAAMVVACGLVRVRYGAALGLFDQLDGVLVQDLSDIPQARIAFKAILAEQTEAGPGSDTMQAALMSQCLVYLLRRLCAGGSCSLPWLAALEDERLARALDRILRDPAKPHTVESLAAASSMSRSSFAEGFARAFGMPPMSLVRRIRLERALRILERGDDLPMEALAHRVGFSSRSHFSRAFKKQFGVAPAVLRASSG